MICHPLQQFIVKDSNKLLNVMNFKINDKHNYIEKLPWMDNE